MQRKWFVLAGSMFAGLALCAGFTAADEDSPLHKLMEQVQSKSTAITKGVRTETAYKKAQKDVLKAAEDMVKLAKEAKPIKDAVKQAKDVKDGDAKWNAMMDDFIKASEDMVKVLSTGKATQAEAKTAHTAVKKSCTPCHDVFRVEAD